MKKRYSGGSHTAAIHHLLAFLPLPREGKT